MVNTLKKNPQLKHNKNKPQTAGRYRHNLEISADKKRTEESLDPVQVKLGQKRADLQK